MDVSFGGGGHWVTVTGNLSSWDRSQRQIFDRYQDGCLAWNGASLSIKFGHKVNTVS